MTQPSNETCKWTLMDDDYGPYYDASCGETYLFPDGSVAENGYRFCPGCGKPIEVKEET